MTKRFILICSLSFLWLFNNAQGLAPTPQQIAQFKGTTTLVLLDGQDVAFDAMLSESIKKFWKVTPFEIINSERFEKEKSNPSFSFLVVTKVSFTKDKIESSYNFLNLLLSHPTGNINDMPVMVYIPFCGAPFTSNLHIYKTAVLIKAIQYQVNQVLINPKKGKLASFNKNIPKLKSKTLLIAKDDVSSEMNDSLLKKLYKSKIRLVSRDEVEQAVIKETESTVILHKVLFEEAATTGRCYKMLIDVNDGTIFYYNMDKVTASKPGTILKKDFRKIRWYPFYWL
jgi:hypothetical protein